MHFNFDLKARGNEKMNKREKLAKRAVKYKIQRSNINVHLSFSA